MNAKAIERWIYIGGGVLAAAIVAILLLSPLDAIWTAVIIFAVAAVALVVQSLIFARRDPGERFYGPRSPEPHA